MTTHDTEDTKDRTTRRAALARTIEFEGHPVTAVMFHGRWCWLASAVGAAAGYEEGRYLVDKIVGEWADEFRLGIDHEVLKGADLKAFREVVGDSTMTSKYAAKVMILTASGVDRALILSRTEKGRRLRDLLVDHVLPQLRASGSATLPGAAPSGLDPEALRALIAATVAEQLRALAPRALAGSAVLDVRARSVVLAPMLAYARKITGPKASQREVMRERGRIDRRMRSLLRFEPKWRLYPEHRLGELLSVLDHERSIAERFAAARAPGAAQPELPLKKN